MKSATNEPIDISIKEGVWSTTINPTMRLDEAFKSSDHVYLIFSINESGGFQGFAEMVGLSNENIKPHIFKRQKNSICYYNNFPIEWKTPRLYFPYRYL